MIKRDIQDLFKNLTKNYKFNVILDGDMKDQMDLAYKMRACAKNTPITIVTGNDLRAGENRNIILLPDREPRIHKSLTDQVGSFIKLLDNSQCRTDPAAAMFEILTIEGKLHVVNCLYDYVTLDAVADRKAVFQSRKNIPVEQRFQLALESLKSEHDDVKSDYSDEDSSDPDEETCVCIHAENVHVHFSRSSKL